MFLKKSTSYNRPEARCELEVYSDLIFEPDIMSKTILDLPLRLLGVRALVTRNSGDSKAAKVDDVRLWLSQDTR